jgi:hypothetical protein
MLVFRYMFEPLFIAMIRSTLLLLLRTGQQCREHRKRCIRSRDESNCDRCIQRGTSCSLQQDHIKVKEGYNIENEDSLQAFFNTLRSIESLEEEISNVEIQIQQRLQQKQLEWQPASSMVNDTEHIRNPNWELEIHSSKSRKLTLNVNIERTAGKLIPLLGLAATCLIYSVKTYH